MSRSVWRCLLFAGAVQLSGACGHRPEQEPGTAVGDVPEGAFARIGSTPLPVDFVPPGGSRDVALGVVHDALLARVATDRQPDRANIVERAALARALLEELARESLEERPITAEELQEQEKTLWLELDRPPSVRTARILVRVPKMGNDQPAWEAIGRIHEAIRTTNNLDDFGAKANAVEVPEELKPEIRVMPPVAIDGRVVPANPYDEGFSSLGADFGRAAHALSQVGEKSGPFGTEEGFNIIVVMELLPGRVAPEDVREARLRAAVADQRAQIALATVRDRLRGSTLVSISSKHENLTRQVWRKH